jgi:hypothetical protein
MSRFLLGVVLVLFSAAVAHADALSPELDKPYRLQVVLHVAGNRQLTQAFKEQVTRELRANLQAALGDLAEVEVVTKHPRLPRVEAEGLKALDGWKEISDTKTHFVLIDFTNDQYVIQARQHDGLTGLSSPLVREARISERQLVSRTASLLVDQDFGLVGTITKILDGDTVEVTLKGGGIADVERWIKLGRWIKKDDVFAVAAVTTGGQGWEVRWTLLRAHKDPQNGVCECKILYRYLYPSKSPLPELPTVRGFRCLHLVTTRAPIRLHFVSEKPDDPLPAGLDIAVSPHSFKEAAIEQRATERGGYFQTERAYDGVAFVKVIVGTRAQVRLPIAVVGERTIECPISLDAQAQTLAELESRRDRWLRQLYERLQLLQLLARDLRDLIDKSAFQAAKEKAMASLEELKNEVKSLQEELAALREAAKEKKAEARLDLGEGSEGVRLLKDLAAQEAKLDEHIKAIDQAIKDEADPIRQRVKALLHQAKIEEEEGNYEQAFAKYDQALGLGVPVQDSVKTHVADLRKAWEPKNDEHRKARQFIYQTWPALKTAKEIDDNAEDAEGALKQCIAVKDKMAPRKLYKVTLAHVSRLEQEFEALKSEGSDDNQKKIETIVKVVDKLKKLLPETAAYLQKK